MLADGLWLSYVTFMRMLAQELERERVNLHLGLAIALLVVLDYLHALPLPAIGALSARVALGVIFFSVYAGWASAPALHRAYAVLEAATIVPSGHPYRVVEVRSNAMAPTVGNGALVVIDFGAYRAHAPRIGDVVAIRLSPKPAYLKRVVALPGDRFEVTGLGVLTNGRRPYGWHNRAYPNYQLEVGDDTIEVDGVPLDRSIANVPPPSAWSEGGRLPRDCYFVLGDDINDSEDSHVFGCVPRRAIIGKVLRVL